MRGVLGCRVCHEKMASGELRFNNADGSTAEVWYLCQECMGLAITQMGRNGQKPDSVVTEQTRRRR